MLVSPPPPTASMTTATMEENPLPIRISPNPRKKIAPEMVRLGSKRHQCPSPLPLIIPSEVAEPRVPVPKHDHRILWFPKTLCFKFQGEEIKQTLKIMNRSKKIINIQYMGIWDGTAKMGASWYIRPKTRMIVAPGLSGILEVRAVPRKHGVVPYATAGIQLATNFEVDLVVGYFVVPVFVEFELSLPSSHVEEEEKLALEGNLDVQIPEKPATLSS